MTDGIAGIDSNDGPVHKQPESPASGECGRCMYLFQFPSGYRISKVKCPTFRRAQEGSAEYERKQHCS